MVLGYQHYFWEHQWLSRDPSDVFEVPGFLLGLLKVLVGELSDPPMDHWDTSIAFGSPRNTSGNTRGTPGSLRGTFGSHMIPYWEYTGCWLELEQPPGNPRNPVETNKCFLHSLYFQWLLHKLESTYSSRQGLLSYFQGLPVGYPVALPRWKNILQQGQRWDNSIWTQLS